MEASKLANPRDVAVALAPALRLCGFCNTWHSKPCGEGCYLRPEDPTYADLCPSAFACPGCGGTSADKHRCTACGFSPADEQPVEPA